MYEHSNNNIELTVCLSMCQRAAGPIGLYSKKLKCRCPVSDVTIEVLRMHAECNHVLVSTLVYVCMLSATIYYVLDWI